MKRVVLATTAAAILVLAAVAPGNAQNGRGSAHGGAARANAAAHSGGGGGRGAAFQGGGGARHFSGDTGAQFRGNRSALARVNPGVQFRGNAGVSPQFHNERHVLTHRRHVRGPVAIYGFGGPGYYDYAEPIYSDDDGCYQVRRVQTEDGWRDVRVYVCGDDD